MLELQFQIHCLTFCRIVRLKLFCWQLKLPPFVVSHDWNEQTQNIFFFCVARQAFHQKCKLFEEEVVWGCIRWAFCTLQEGCSQGAQLAKGLQGARLARALPKEEKEACVTLASLPVLQYPHSHQLQALCCTVLFCTWDPMCITHVT